MSEISNQNQQDSQNVQAAVSAALQDEKKKKKKKKLIIFAIIAVVLIVIIAAAGSDSDSENGENDGATNAPVQAEQNNTAVDTLGDFKCVVKSAKLTKDYEGKDAVLITYEFTNNSQEAASFDLSLDDYVYQDGVGLEIAYLGVDEEQDFGLDVKIKPGVTKEVKKAYILRDTTTDLDVEITEFISFNDDKIVTTVKIAK